MTRACLVMKPATNQPNQPHQPQALLTSLSVSSSTVTPSAATLTAKRRRYKPHLLTKPSMRQFVILSILCHILAVLLLGDASGERGGAATFGSFVARLSPSSVQSTNKTSPSGANQNVINAVSESRAARTARAQEGVAAPEAVTAAPDPEATTPSVAATQPPPQEAVSAPPKVAVTPIEPLPLLSVETPTAPATFVVPLLATPPTSTIIEPAAVQPLTPTLAIEPIALPRSVEPLVAPIAAPRITLESLDTKPVVTVEPKLRVEPITLPPSPTMLVAPILSTPAPAIEPSTVQPLALKIPDAPAALPTQVEPLRTLEPVIPPLPTPALARDVKPIDVSPQVFTPAAPIAATPSTAQVPSVPTPASVQAAPATATAPAPAPAPTPTPATIQAPAASAPSAPVVAREATALPSAAGLPGVPGTPSAQAPLPGSAGAPLPKLDIDSLRSRAQQIASPGTGPRTLLPFPTAPPDPAKNNMERIFDKALKRPDCREAYRDMGLAAVLPLVRDALKDGGCKW